MTSLQDVEEAWHQACRAQSGQCASVASTGRAWFYIPINQLDERALVCAKPVCGLSEAPLAWQLCTNSWSGGQRSCFDENFWFWSCSKLPPRSRAVAWPTACSDAHEVGSGRDTQTARQDKIKPWDPSTGKVVGTANEGRSGRQARPCMCEVTKTKKFGKLTRQTLWMQVFQATIRSVIGALMWCGVTRPNILAELSNIQTVSNKGKIKDMRRANALIQQAKSTGEVSLEAIRARSVCVHDASSATSARNYAQEGILVLLMTDNTPMHIERLECGDYQCGVAHLLRAQTATMVRARMAEITYGKIKPSLRQLLAIKGLYRKTAHLHHGSQRGTRIWPIEMDVSHSDRLRDV